MKTIFVVAILAATLGVWAFPATAEEVPPEQSPLATACQIARSTAAIAGLNMEKCRRVEEVVDGNVALVTVKVKITDQGWFNVTVALFRSAWGQTGISVSPS